MGPDARVKLKIAIKGAKNPKDETNPSQPTIPSYVVGEVLEQGFIVLNTDRMLPEDFVAYVNNHRLEVEAEVQLVG